MLTELAHYLLIFAAAVFGFQTVALSPVTWGAPSAVAIRTAYRGILFGCFLLALCFAGFCACYFVRDFSVAVVFETFAADLPSSLFFNALMSSREGFFFVALLVFAGVFVVDSSENLPTYRERGRYLFAGTFVLFFLSVLMICTANPFVRLSDPPLDGASLNPYWKTPFMTVKTLCQTAAYALLTAVFVRIVSVYDKGWRFADRALVNSVGAAIFLTVALAADVFAAFYGVDSQTLLTWEPSATLIFALFLMTAAQSMALYAGRSGHVYAMPALMFSLCGLLTAFGAFFSAEYNLFLLKSNKVYFPNPVIALSATGAMMSLMLFCAFSFIKKTLPEDGFPLLSRKTFFGLAAAAPAALAALLTVVSYSPVFMLFRGAPMWRDIPAFLTKQTLIYAVVGTVFLTAGLLCASADGKRVRVRKKLVLCFCALMVAVFGTAGFFYGAAAVDILLWTLPSSIVFLAVLNSLNFKIAPVPQTFGAFFARLKSIGLRSYALFFTGFGFMLLSFSLATALNAQSVAIEPLDMQNGTVVAGFKLMPADGVTLENIRQEKNAVIDVFSEKTARKASFFTIDPALAPESSVVTQGVLVSGPHAVFVKIQMANEKEPVCTVVLRPFLRVLPVAFFCLTAGLVLLFLFLRAKGGKVG